MRQPGPGTGQTGEALIQAELPEDSKGGKGGEDGARSFGEALVQQIEFSLQLFYASADYDDVDRLVMAGSAANLDGLASLVAARLGTPCSVAAPFTGMSVAPGLDRAELLRAAPALTVACGLALRGFA